MAEAIRQKEELLTVRLDLQMTDKGMRVVADAFRGGNPLGSELRFPLEDLGSDTGGQQSFAPSTRPPTRLIEVFDTVRNHAGPEEPVWIQIAYGADLLAAYPWEDVFSPVVKRQILRIPNFFRSGYRREPDRPLAICAVAPIAKGSPDWSEPLHRLLASLNGSETREVVLFVDERSHHKARDLGDYPKLQIRLPHPARLDAPVRETAIIQRSDIVNPWLAWMAQELGSGGAHAVHFICPGFSRDARGALALPETPHGDGDPHWARFVGVEEFARFANKIDAQATGFSALGDNIWKEGIRLFTNELCWVRPGPVIADFGGSDGAALDAAYSMLFGYRALASEPVPGLVLSVHPALLHEESDEVASLRSIQRGADLTTAADSVHFEARLGVPSGTVPREVARAIDQLSSARPRSPVESARDRGTARAMEFVAGLAQKSRTR